MKIDVAIVGGGLIGLNCAYFLQKLGVSVGIFEKNVVGREASWAGAGILSPLNPALYPEPVLQLASHSATQYPLIVQELLESSGVDSEYVESGLIILDGGLSPRSAGYTHLSVADLLSLEPNLNASDVAHSLLIKNIGQVRSPRLLEAYRLTLARSPGVRFFPNQAVTEFIVRNDRLVGLKTAAGDIKTEYCVVTAGAWSGDLLRKTGLELAIEPVRGQILLMRAAIGQIRHILVKKYRYILQRKDGRVLIGSTLERVGFDRSITAEARETLHQTALSLIPSLADCPIEAQWAGLRPSSPDQIPFIGEHPRFKGLFVCAGHYRNGIALAPASAKLVVDLILNNSLAIDPNPFRLDRAITQSG